MQKEFVNMLDFNHRFAYRGSLTTPPYTEHLLWNVLENVIALQPRTLKLFENHNITKGISGLYPALGGSNRVLQDINDRNIIRVSIDDMHAISASAVVMDDEVPAE